MSVRENGSRDGFHPPISLLAGALVDIVFLSLVTGLLLVLPPVVTFFVPFSFPIWNAMALYALSVAVIVLAVAIDTVQEAVSRG